MANDNVTKFPGKGELPENPVIVGDNRGYCPHPAITLNQHDRTVTCAKCGANLDPFAYLLGEAKAIRAAWDHHRMVEAKARQVSERITLLEKEAKRLASRVRTLKKKAPDDVFDFRKPL